MMRVESETMIEHKYFPLGRSQKDEIMFVQKIVKFSAELVFRTEQLRENVE